MSIIFEGDTFKVEPCMSDVGGIRFEVDFIYRYDGLSYGEENFSSTNFDFGCGAGILGEAVVS